MRKVLVYSLLLVIGLGLSQLLPLLLGPATHAYEVVIEVLTMTALAFIMIHVGYEFEIDKHDLRQYGVDYLVAASAAALPWLLCALYFMFVMTPRPLWTNNEAWKETLLASCFSAPTSAGVLFAMLAAAGLAATWMFQKARVLAIFDDLFAILLLLPLKALLVGLNWQLFVTIGVIGSLLVLAWRRTHEVLIPIRWRWVLAYSAGLTALSQLIYLASRQIDADRPLQIEVLLPAFVLGCIMARPLGSNPHRDDALEGHEQGPESATEQRVATIVSACFMILVGLSMPIIETQPKADPREAAHFPGVPAAVLQAKNEFPGWGWITVHTLAITLLSNLGKMVPFVCYRERPWRERLALAISMFPRGEVGAGVLVISLGYGVRGPIITVAVLSLALNLMLTGLFILAVKKLLAGSRPIVPQSRENSVKTLAFPPAPP